MKLGLPAHGHPFTDVPGRVEAIKEHHFERMEKLRDASLAIGPADVVELSHEVFPERHWGVMAESETFAHLEHLRARPVTPSAGTTTASLDVPRRRRELTARGAGATVPAWPTISPPKPPALLQDLIRNACVNDGTPESGEEVRSADLLAGYLGYGGLDVETLRAAARSGAACSPGSRARDPTAPTLLLMGHTDVVPVNVDGWSRDPFAAEIVDGMVWGRGAVDMLNLTVDDGGRVPPPRCSRASSPRARCSYLAVADEEALGTWGAEYLVEHELDDVQRRLRGHRVGRLPDADHERARACRSWSRRRARSGRSITVRGTPGHASQPYRTDNALVTAAEVVRRIAEYRPEPRDRRHVAAASSRGSDCPTELRRRRIVSTSSIDGAAARSRAHRALVHAHDVRADGRARRHEDEHHPGPRRPRGRHPHAARPDAATVARELLIEAIGDLARQGRDHVERRPASTASPIDTPLWDALAA